MFVQPNVCYQMVLTDVWFTDDAMYEEVAQGLLDRKQQMFNKFRSLLYAEAMVREILYLTVVTKVPSIKSLLRAHVNLQRPQPMSEMVMLEKMFIQAERELLENDRKVAKETPGKLSRFQAMCDKYI